MYISKVTFSKGIVDMYIFDVNLFFFYHVGTHVVYFAEFIAVVFIQMAPTSYTY